MGHNKMSAIQIEEPTGAATLAGSEHNTIDTQPIVHDEGFQSKCLTTLQATAALAGYRLCKVGSGFLIQRYGSVTHCTDLDTVDAQLRRMGAQ
jgi:hypothetical protein